MTKRRAHGEGTVFKRKDGKWQASFVSNNGKRMYFYGKTQQAAREKMHEAQKEDKQGILATGEHQKLGDYLVQWLESTHKPPMVKTGTYAQYRSYINLHLKPTLGNVYLHKLTPQQIQAVYSQKTQEGLAPGSIYVMHSILHGALENAVKWNLVSRNVASLVSLPRLIHEEIHPLTLEESQKLIRVAKDSKLDALLTVAITTGMRRGEILGLRWSDIDFEQGALYVRRTLTRIGGFGFIENDPKTKTSKRRILLPDVTMKVLREHQACQDQFKQSVGSKWKENNLVFPNTVGNFLNPERLIVLFRRVLKQAGLPRIRFHDLRHSAATILLAMNVHPKVVQELLGHSTMAITMDTYSHLFPSMLQDAMRKMDDVFKENED